MMINSFMPEPLWLCFVFFYAATIASFICLAVERLPHQLKWRDDANSNLTIWSPGSMCNSCGTKIRWLFLIPVLGYFFSKGKCYSCKERIPLIYPLTEALCGGICVAIFYFGNDFYKSSLLCCLFLTLTFLSLIDIKETWLPACVTFPLFWGGLLISPFATDSDRIMGAFSAFCIIYFSMKFVSILKKEDLVAGGDVALATAAGAWLGVSATLLFLGMSSMVFILYSLPFRMKGITFVPMGPALSIGFFLCLLYLL